MSLVPNLGPSSAAEPSQSSLIEEGDHIERDELGDDDDEDDEDYDENYEEEDADDGEEEDEDRLYKNFLTFLADGDFDDGEEDDDDFNPEEVEEDEEEEDDDDDVDFYEENVHDVLESYPYSYPPSSYGQPFYPAPYGQVFPGPPPLLTALEEDEEEDEDYHDAFYREREGAEDFRVRPKEVRELLQDGWRAFSDAPIDLSYYQQQTGHSQGPPPGPPPEHYPPYTYPAPGLSLPPPGSSSDYPYHMEGTPYRTMDYGEEAYSGPPQDYQMDYYPAPYPSYPATTHACSAPHWSSGGPLSGPSPSGLAEGYTPIEPLNENSNSHLLLSLEAHGETGASLGNAPGLANPLYPSSIPPSIFSAASFDSTQTDSLCTDGAPINAIRLLLARQINLFLQLMYLLYASTQHDLPGLFPVAPSSSQREGGGSRREGDTEAEEKEEEKRPDDEQTETRTREQERERQREKDILRDLNRRLSQVQRQWAALRLSSIKKATFLKIQMRSLEETALSEGNAYTQKDRQGNRERHEDALADEIRGFKRPRVDGQSSSMSANTSTPSSSLSASLSRPLTRSLLAENTSRYTSDSLFDHPLASDAFFSFFKSDLSATEEAFRSEVFNSSSSTSSAERQIGSLRYLDYFMRIKRLIQLKMAGFYARNSTFYDSSIGPPLVISSCVFPTHTYPFQNLPLVLRADREAQRQLIEEAETEETDETLSVQSHQTSRLASSAFTPSQLDLFFRAMATCFSPAKHLENQPEGQPFSLQTLLEHRNFPLDLIARSLDPYLRGPQLKKYIERKAKSNEFSRFNRFQLQMSQKWKVNDKDRWSLLEELKIFRVFQSFSNSLVPGNLYGLFHQRKIEDLVSRWSTLQKTWKKSSNLVYTEAEEGRTELFDDPGYDSDELVEDGEEGTSGPSFTQRGATVKTHPVFSSGASAFLKDLLRCSKTSHFSEICRGTSKHLDRSLKVSPVIPPAGINPTIYPPIIVPAAGSDGQVSSSTGFILPSQPSYPQYASEMDQDIEEDEI